MIHISRLMLLVVWQQGRKFILVNLLHPLFLYDDLLVMLTLILFFSTIYQFKSQCSFDISIHKHFLSPVHHGITHRANHFFHKPSPCYFSWRRQPQWYVNSIINIILLFMCYIIQERFNIHIFCWVQDFCLGFRLKFLELWSLTVQAQQTDKTSDQWCYVYSHAWNQMNFFLQVV